MKKSKLGYEITAIGKNPEFAEATGMNVGKKIIIMMLISGALSGVAGAGWMLSDQFKYTLTFSANPGLGWDADCSARWTFANWNFDRGNLLCCIKNR